MSHEIIDSIGICACLALCAIAWRFFWGFGD